LNTVLDAPDLRDDYYCSLLAYSYTTHSLAVGLDQTVYIWSENHGPRRLVNGNAWHTPHLSHLTSLAFSSAEGANSVLAIGRQDGQIVLWSLYEDEPRFEAQQPSGIACTSWKPCVTMRRSLRTPESTNMVPTEELIVGDEVGNIYYYSIEWPKTQDLQHDDWPGAMTLLRRIDVHTQQICGLAWSPKGDYFASGGNDNACCLFDAYAVTGRDNPSAAISSDGTEVSYMEDGRLRIRIMPGTGPTTDGREKHRWMHSAAVKAIAFCPWQTGLIATGGGSNDRCIHFYHTGSGACLAQINVAAQVTSLIWSTTHREIAVTFGYASPEHPIRIAVFTWPACKQVVAIPWVGDLRALYAISYPKGPDETNRLRGDEFGKAGSRGCDEGCLVVAASDQSVKFHEVWGKTKKGVGLAKGVLGGSDILESLEGIDKESAETIR
jgi:meiosis-specific APC/C activator protein AMA1